MIALPPWSAAALAIPVLLWGGWLNRHVPAFARFNLPISVTGGLSVALAAAMLTVFGGPPVVWQSQVPASLWTWWVIPFASWGAHPALPANTPLLVAFFTCIGLNATWPLLRRGSWPLLLFLFVATILAVVQNLVGIGVARLLGQSPLLGMMCGAVTMTGGHGTAMGFAPAFVQAGMPAAASVGAAAATFGLVAGGLMGALMGTSLIRRLAGLRAGVAPSSTGPDLPSGPAGFPDQVRALAVLGGPVWRHAAVLLICIKGGAEVSHALQRAGLLFPAYMGAMLVGLVVRNLSDLVAPGFLRTDVVDRLGAVLLGLFLAMTLMSIALGDLAAVAVPMLVILFVQVGVAVLFAAFATWPAMGKDYEAAVMAAGHVGFGLGNTATAVADMDALAARYGPAPRAYTIVPPTGGFLIDLTNAVVITAFLNLYR